MKDRSSDGDAAAEGDRTDGDHGVAGERGG
jgi:hypothetical protein